MQATGMSHNVPSSPLGIYAPCPITAELPPFAEWQSALNFIFSRCPERLLN